jgi:hypothetical protein
MSKGRFAAVFQPKKPVAAAESEPDGPVESKLKPARKPKSAPARAPRARPSAKTKSGRQRIPVVRWVAADSLVTVGAKVPAEVAQHWAIEAKRQRTSISYLINQALISAFGVPEGAILPEGESG